VRERRRSDPKVVRAHRFPPSAEIRPNGGMYARDWLGNRQRLETCEHMLDERAPVRLPCTGRPVDAMEQLADGDDADRTRLVADELLERRRLVPLPLDEDVCVD
jgi:hypothetical protein